MARTRVIRRRHRNPPTLRGGKVAVGFPQGETDGDVIDIAVWNHFGTRTIPERPFIENALRENEGAYRVAMRAAAQAILDERYSLRTALERLGLKAVADIRAEITALQTPPNAPSTIARKGSSNPLIDTGRMRRAVTHEVRDA